jgi:hypothetical protein
VGVTLHSYHATVDQPSAETAAGEARARRQDDAVLRWFRGHPGREFTPEEVHAACMPHAPLTSARRAITNLTTARRLEKTSRTRVGQYGRRAHTWRLRTAEPAQGALL